MSAMEPLRLVLVGSTGVAGSAILRAARHVELRALVRGDAARLGDHPCTPVVGALPDVPQALFPEAPHVVLHFAGANVDPAQFTSVNVEGTRALIDALPPSCLGVIYGSSLSVVGSGPQRGVDERAPVAPDTALARSRAAAEAIVLEGAARRGISAFALRPRFLLGDGDRATLPALLRLARRGISLGSGTQAFSVIDLDDYAAIVLALARRIVERAARGEPVQTPLHVGYTRPISFDEIRGALSEQLPLPAPRVRIPTGPRLTRALQRITRLHDVATKLALVGLDHHADVRRLSAEIGGAIVARDPRTVVTKAARSLLEGTQA